MKRKITLVSAAVLASLTGSFSAFAEDYNPVLSRVITVSTNQGGATINFSVLMEQFRSIPSSTNGGRTVNKKIVRFVVDNARSGSGFHSVDRLGTTSNPSINARFEGGFQEVHGAVSEYDIKITPSGRPVELFQHAPRNTNKEFNFDERYSTTFGTNASFGVQVDSSGPKLSTDVGSSTSRTTLNRLQFSTNEYRTNNSTSSGQFRVSFINTTLEGCGGAYLRVPSGGGCESRISLPNVRRFTLERFGQNVFDLGKFSPIAYANFTPNFGASFDVDPSENGKSSFNISFAMQTGTLRGEGLWDDFTGFSGPMVYKANGFVNGRKIEASTDVEVDWAHPIFGANTTVRIQSLRTRNSCLEAVTNPSNLMNANYLLEFRECASSKKSQVWSLNSQGQYRSGIGVNQCLELGDDDTRLVVRDCGSSNAQRWQWNRNQLENFLFGSDGRNRVLTHLVNHPNPDVGEAHPSGFTSPGRSYLQELEPRVVNVNF